MTTYHVGLRQHLEAFTKVKDEFIGQPYPAWSAIGVSELITEGTLIEIRVIAKRYEQAAPDEPLPTGASKYGS
jgi:enamine deaminase RidA (YjgF/YER057c/UK114 family)